MPFVVDASTALAWCFEDEVDAYADGVLLAFFADNAIAPAIWPLEVANGLLTAERRGRLSGAEVLRAALFIRALPVRIAGVPTDRALGNLLELARSFGLMSYDAAYLELAIREGLPLATNDEQLRAAAEREGVIPYRLSRP